MGQCESDTLKVNALNVCRCMVWGVQYSTCIIIACVHVCEVSTNYKVTTIKDAS